MGLVRNQKAKDINHIKDLSRESSVLRGVCTDTHFRLLEKFPEKVSIVQIK